MYGWPEAFACTLALELPVYWAVLRKPWPGLALNVATHPLFWFLAFKYDSVMSNIPAAEFTIMAVEALGAWLVVRDWRRAALASAAANSLSWLAGPWILARFH